MKNRISYLIIRVDKDRVSVALSKVLVKALATLQGSRRALQGTNRSPGTIGKTLTTITRSSSVLRRFG